MTYDWLLSKRTRMDTRGYSLMWLIVLAKLLASTTHALFLALVSALVASLLRTSRLHALRYHTTGAHVHAPVSREVHTRIFLERHGGAIHLLGLDGFLRRLLFWIVLPLAGCALVVAAALGRALCLACLTNEARVSPEELRPSSLPMGRRHKPGATSEDRKLVTSTRSAPSYDRSAAVQWVRHLLVRDALKTHWVARRSVPARPAQGRR